MSYVSTLFGAAAQGVESMVADDLSFSSELGSELKIHLADPDLLRATAAVVVDFQDCGGTDARSAAEAVCEDRPDIAAKYREHEVEALAALILSSELAGLSSHFEALFQEFNGTYFSGKLPAHRVRVVFDLHRVAEEPVYRGSVSSGLIRFEERCIYVRFTNRALMEGILLHEMAHAATNCGHGEAWLNEMRRLRDAGAPVPDWEFEPAL